MGSSLSPGQSVLLAVFFGILFLVFDAARDFAQNLGPMRLRRWSGSDPGIERGSRWFHYDPRRFSLITGALLQMSLAVAIAFTVSAEWHRGAALAALIAICLWIAILIVWKFLLAVLPESVAEIALRSILPVSYIFYYIFWPLIFPLRWVLDKQNQMRENGEEEEVTEEELQAYIDVGEEEGILESEEAKLVQSIVDFGDRLAREIMTPRIDVEAFDVEKSIDALASLFSESKYSRIPVYEGNIDRVVGVVHVKDLLDVILRDDKKVVRDIARPPFFVSETRRISDLLREFQKQHLQIAIVVDEYGGTAGIITIEDMMEEIVGDIADEHEEIEEPIVEIGPETFLVTGITHVDTIEDLFHVELQGEGYETIAGLIFTFTGRVPKTGTVLHNNGLIFEVERADRRRIYSVKIRRDPDWHSSDEQERG